MCDHVRRIQYNNSPLPLTEAQNRHRTDMDLMEMNEPLGLPIHRGTTIAILPNFTSLCLLVSSRHQECTAARL